MNNLSVDLTRGSIPRQLLRFALPMVTTSLLQSVYGLTDFFVVGFFVGSRGLSAVNNSSQIVMILTNIAVGLTTGGGIVIGQRFGQENAEGVRRASGTMITSCSLCGILGGILLYLFSAPLLGLLGAPAFSEAKAYLDISALGIFFIFAYNAFSSLLRSIGNSKMPFWFILVSVSLNILLDLLLVGRLGWGVEGAAWATVAAQIACFFIALGYLIRSREFFGVPGIFGTCHREDLALILRLGIPSAVQMTVAGLSWLSVTFLINRYGVIVSAGNGISVKIKELCQLTIGSLSGSASVMIAQNLGARRYDRAKSVLYTAMGCAVAVALLSIAVVELFAPQLAALFIGDAASAGAVVEAAARNMRIEILSMPFYAVFLMFHALAIGAGHSTFALLSSFVNCILFRLVLAFSLNRLWGLDGIYWACMIAPSTSIPLGIYYVRSGAWRRSLD